MLFDSQQMNVAFLLSRNASPDVIRPCPFATTSWIKLNISSPQNRAEASSLSNYITVLLAQLISRPEADGGRGHVLLIASRHFISKVVYKSNFDGRHVGLVDLLW